MKFHFIFLLCAAFIFKTAFPQPKLPVPKKPIAGDCNKAILLTLDNNRVYGITVPPAGPGETQEIHNGSGRLFDEEHNTSWYLLSVEKNGELIFEITPEDTTNDYDFLLYPYTDSTFCDAFLNNRLKPLRSNLSNVKKSVRGITGLSKSDAFKTSIGKGPGPAYSRSIGVKKGERYILILDNVTPNGKGHTLEFSFIRDVEIKGRALNSENGAVIADLTLSDAEGNILQETKSDKDGEYSIKATLKENQNYSLVAISDSTFVQTTILNTKDLKKDSVFRDIRLILPKLKKGNKYKLGNINFYGNVAVLVPASLPSVDALYKLMRRNKKMIIRIEGHVNDPAQTSPDETFNQKLSEDRANCVYDILAQKGIDKKRMSIAGMSNKFPLFKAPKNENQSKANRRVEINVISIE